MKVQNKIKTQTQTTEEVSSNEIKKLIILIIVVTAIFFIFYGITTLIVKKDKETSEPVKTKTEISFEKILISQLLNQPENNYYVLVTIENDANNTTYESLKESYYEKEDHLKIYSANLNDPLNKSFIGDTTNLQGEIKDFKFEKSTLVEIENKTIKGIYEGSTDILSKLNDIK